MPNSKRRWKIYSQIIIQLTLDRLQFSFSPYPTPFDFVLAFVLSLLLSSFYLLALAALSLVVLRLVFSVVPFLLPLLFSVVLFFVLLIAHLFVPELANH